jgi:hypothetical protein
VETLQSLLTLKKCTGNIDFQSNEPPPQSSKKVFSAKTLCVSNEQLALVTAIALDADSGVVNPKAMVI